MCIVIELKLCYYSLWYCTWITFCVIGLWFIHSFMQHYECIVPDTDIILESEWFWAMSIALFRERFSDSRSCWVVFIHVVRRHPSGLLQLSKGEAVKICLASDLSVIRAMWPNRESDGWDGRSITFFLHLLLCLVTAYLGSVSDHCSSLDSAQLATGNSSLCTTVQGLILNLILNYLYICGRKCKSIHYRQKGRHRDTVLKK